MLNKAGITWNGGSEIDIWGTLKIGGTALTATAAELNALASGGIDAAELAFINGAVAGTLTASKCVVVDAASAVDVMKIKALWVGATPVAVTATAAELNTLAGVTAGTSAASKAVVLSSASKINALDITALTLNGTLLSATAAELNLVTYEVVRTFTETAGSGTYTATVAVPAGYTVIDVLLVQKVAWASETSAVITVGDAGDPDGYFTATTNLKTTAVDTYSCMNGDTGADTYKDELPKAYATAGVITAAVAAVDAAEAGGAGRTDLVVRMVKTATNVAAATKA